MGVFDDPKYFEQEETTTKKPPQAQPQQQQQQPSGVQLNVSADEKSVDYIKDVATGILGGARDAVANTLSLPTDLGEMAGIVSPETAKKARQILPEVAQQESVAGELTRGVVRFGLGFVGAGKIMAPIKAFQAMKNAGLAGRLAAGAVQGGVGDFTVAGAAEKNLSDLVQQFPSLENPITEYLASGNNDDAATSRFKTALEGVLLGGAVDLVIAGAKGTKKLIAARAAGDPAAEARVAAEVADDVQKAFEESSVRPVDEEAVLPQNIRDEVWKAETKVRDAEGKPLRVFHGTGETFEKFDADKGMGAGTWFTDSADMADVFAKGDAPQIKPAFLDIRNPIDGDEYMRLLEEGSGTRNLREDLMAQGYDGVIFKPQDRTDALSGSRYLVFDPEKSVKEAFPAKDGGTKKLYRAEKADGSGPYKQDIYGDADGKGEGLFFSGSREQAEQFLKDAPGGRIVELEVPAKDAAEFKTKNVLDEYFVPADKAKGRKPLVTQSGNIVMADKLRERIAMARSAGFDGTDRVLETGVLNVNHMDSPENTLRAVSEAAQVFMEEGATNLKGTYRSHEATKSIANLFGVKPEQVFSRLQTLAKDMRYVDAWAKAGDALTQSMSRELSELADSITAGVGGEVAKAEFVKRANVLYDLMDNLGAVQTAGARLTSSRGISATDNVSGNKIADMLSQMGVEEIAERVRMAGKGNARGVIASLQPPTGFQKFMGIHNYLWVNSILSGAKTTVVNVTSNFIQTAIMPAQKLLGGAFTGDVGAMKEAVYQYAAWRSSLFDSLEMARRAWNLDRAILDPGSIPTENSLRPLSSPYLGLDQHSVLGHGVDWLGKIVGIPGRFLNTQDEFFKQLNYRANVKAKAWVDAADRVKAGTLQPEEVAEYVETIMDEAFTKMRALSSDGTETFVQGAATNKDALRMAQEATFTQSLQAETWLGGRTISEVIAQGPGSHPLIRGTVLPFIKVPTNLMRTFSDMSAAPWRWANMAAEFRAGGERRAMMLGKLGTGAMLWSGAAILAHEGRITGAGPQDKDLQRELRQNGWQPYSYVSFNDDGTRTYIPFGKLDPLAYFFGLAADFAYISGKTQDAQMDDLATRLTVSLAHNISSKTYLRGVIDVMGMLGGGYDKEAAVQKWLQYRVASYVPSIAGAMNPDDELKEARSVMDAVMSRIPGLSQTVEAKRDNFGKKMLAPMGYPWSAVNPFAMTTTPGDRVREELSNLAVSNVDAKFIMPPDKVANGTIDLTRLKLTSGQTAWDRWAELLGEHKVGGKTLHESLDALIGSDVYKTARGRMGQGDATYNQSFAVDLIKQRMDTHRNVTFEKLQQELPELRRAMIDYKRNSAVGRVLGPSSIESNPLIRR